MNFLRAASLLGLFLMASYSSVAVSAELYGPELRAAPHRQLKRVVRSDDCRTGWWRVHQNGKFNPRWGTRCSLVLARR